MKMLNVIKLSILVLAATSTAYADEVYDEMDAPQRSCWNQSEAGLMTSTAIYPVGAGANAALCDDSRSMGFFKSVCDILSIKTFGTPGGLPANPNLQVPQGGGACQIVSGSNWSDATCKCGFRPISTQICNVEFQPLKMARPSKKCGSVQPAGEYQQAEEMPAPESDSSPSRATTRSGSALLKSLSF